MISKELLSEVLGIEVVLIKVVHNDDKRYVFYDYEEKVGKIIETSINTYELANKCKDWAKHKGYCILSCITESKSICLFDLKSRAIDDYRNVKNADSEPEAIFKACEWIMEQQDG